MRKLWQEVLQLLRSHVVLWLPVLCASMLTYFIEYLRPTIVWHVGIASLHWMAPHSAFGGPPVGQTSATEGSVVAIMSTMRLILQFLNIVCFAIAFFVTANMIEEISRRSRADIGTSLKLSRRALKNTVFLSLVVLAISAAAFALMASSIPFISREVHLDPIHFGNYTGTAFAVVLYGLLSWLVTPLALKSLQPPGQVAKPETISLARQYSFVVSLTMTVAYLLLSSIHHPRFFDRQATMAWTLASTAVTNLPYAPLYAGLALLVLRQEQGMAGDAGPQTRRHEGFSLEVDVSP